MSENKNASEQSTDKGYTDISGNTEHFSENEKRIHEQIHECFHRAWRDLLYEKVLATPPDFDWIVNLYREMRHKLSFFLKKGSAFRVSIEEGLDVELFDQMIRHGAFQGPEFYNLINYVFDLCLKLGSPARDDDVKGLRDEVLTLLSNKGTFAQLVPLFFININTAVDWVHKDLSLVPEQLKKIVGEIKNNGQNVKM